jgi:low temperature requirement protein LtrA
MPSRTFLRSPFGQGHHRVTYVELLFDLVFAFAITQLSHLLIERFSPATAGEASFLLLAVWWVWIFTAWVTNSLDPDRLPVRAMLLALTVLGLVLAAAIPQAFNSRGFAFASAYVLMQVGRTAFVVWGAARSQDAGTLRTFRRILAWLALTAVFWIAGGLADGTVRWWLWGLALGLEFISPSVGFWVPGLGRSATRDWNVEGGHMAERCALFVLIALGESVLVTGATFAALEWTYAMIAALLTSLIGSIAMWWLYFDTAADVGGEILSKSHDPGRLARLAYAYIHLLLVAGIVLSAVGDEFILTHPVGDADAKTTIAVLGGAALYLAGNGLFKWTIVGRICNWHLGSIATLGAVALVADYLTPLMLMAAASLVLVVLVIVEERSRRAAPREMPSSRPWS